MTEEVKARAVAAHEAAKSQAIGMRIITIAVDMDGQFLMRTNLDAAKAIEVMNAACDGISKERQGS